MLSAWTCLAPGARLPLRSPSSHQLGEARGGTQGWDLSALAFTRTSARGGTGGGGQRTGLGGAPGGTGAGPFGADRSIRGGRARRPGLADPGWRPALHPPSHRLSQGAPAHTPSWGSKWSLPGGWPCCSNKAGGAAAWGQQMLLVARGIRAQAERSREGGAGVASRSRSSSRSSSR